MHAPAVTMPAPPNGKRLGRARRAIAACAKAAGLSVVFGVAAVAGVLLHAGLRAPRELTIATVNDLLASSFQGEVRLHDVDVVRLDRLEGIDGEVFDPEGNRVLAIRGASVRFRAWTILRSFFIGDRTKIGLGEVSVPSAEIVLEEDDAGEIGLFRAFASRTPPSTEPSRPTEVTLGRVEIGHVWVHGRLDAVPVLDVDVDGLSGSFHAGPERTDVDVQRLYVRARGLEGLSPEGTIVARAVIPEDESEIDARAHYNGYVGEIPVVLDASLSKRTVLASIDVAETDAGAFDAIDPDRIHLGGPVRLHADIEGSLPLLLADVHAEVGDTTIGARATVGLPQSDSPAVIAARVDADHVDARLADPTAPHSDLSATIGAVAIVRDGRQFFGGFELQNEAGHVDGQSVPAATLSGAFTERSIHAQGFIAERGAPTTIHMSLEPRGSATSPSLLSFATSTVIDDLDQVERIGPLARGEATIRTEGAVDLEAKRIDLTAEASVNGMAKDGVAVASANATLRVGGTFETPTLDAELKGTGLRGYGYSFSSFDGTVSGAKDIMAVRANLTGDNRTPNIRANAQLSTGAGLTVRAPRIELERGDVKAVVTAELVRALPGGAQVKGLVVDGLGDRLTGDVSMEHKNLSIKAMTSGVDLSRVAKLVAREEDLAGRMALDIDARVRQTTANGKVVVKLDGLRARGIEGADADVALTLDGRQIRGSVTASMAPIGKLHAELQDVTVGGPILEPRAWSRATGTMVLDADVDVAELLARVPADKRPVSKTSGTIAIRGNVSRPNAASDPSVELEIVTKKLTITGPEKPKVLVDGVAIAEGPPWHLSGIDATLKASFDGATGRADLAAALRDRKGELASLKASAKPPLRRMLEDPKSIEAIVGELPIELGVEIPRRSIVDLPGELGTRPIQGEIALSGTFKGSLRAPELSLTATATNLRPRGAAACARSLDVTTDVTYDGSKGHVQLTAATGKRPVMTADATIALDSKRVASGNGPLDWNASGDVTFTKFPLEIVSVVLAKPVTGTVNGTVSVHDLHRAAWMEGKLDVRDLVIDRASVPKGELSLTMKDRAFTAGVTLEQSDGRFAATATGAMSWRDELVPVFDRQRPIDIKLAAKNFRADIIRPFVETTLSDLDGRIDTNAKIHIEPGAKDGTMDGAIVLRDGVVEVPQIGERLHGIKGSIIIKPWGTLRLDGFEARGPTGRLTASAQAVLDGLTLKSAKAKLSIPKDESMPLAIEGVPMGRAYGDILATATMSGDGKRLDVKVDVPTLEVALPQSSGNDVQKLPGDKNVSIGFHDGKKFVPIAVTKPKRPRKPSETTVVAEIHLGEHVRVTREGMLDVTLGGKVVIEDKDETRVSGEIRIVRGQLELQGKIFTIDRGVVSFVGTDPSNPMVQANAYWDAPDGTRVLAAFTGFVEEGKLTLRSDPALTEDEILALLLFGSKDGGFGASQSSDQSGIGAVGGIAGGVVTQGLNKAISGVTTRVTTRIDSSDSSGPEPQIVVQLTERIAARLGYRIGGGAPGSDPDRAEVTLDWRFFKNWRLETTVGDHGSTSVELVWRLHY
ncbi:MAG: hypothetical protein HOW73_04110 [Polyangiaceae bacterium]|nr:hypothetical protein [Polyangiaceae bacterium]